MVFVLTPVQSPTLWVSGNVDKNSPYCGWWRKNRPHSPKTKNKKEKRVICFAQSGSPSKISSEDCVVFVFVFFCGGLCVCCFFCVCFYFVLFFWWVVFCIFVFCFLFACFSLTPNWPSVRDSTSRWKAEALIERHLWTNVLVTTA